MSEPHGILRTALDPGLLSNIRMGAEISTGVAFLTGRRLSMPFDEPLRGAPASSIAEPDRGQPATLSHLYEFPIEVVRPDEWQSLQDKRALTTDWGLVQDAVLVCGNVDSQDPGLLDFANGRKRFLRLPAPDAAIVDLQGRMLSFYSYFFFAAPALRRQLYAVLSGVRPRAPYRSLGAAIARDLGVFNAVHIRRSDLIIGIKAYKNVTATDVADNLAEILDAQTPLVVCSEVSAGDDFFDPLRSRFSNLVFANDLILQDYRAGFFDLPRHEDNVLGLVTQQLATRAQHFVGTIGSTFTAMIQRERVQRDPDEPFRFTADFTPPGPRFERCEFVELQDGTYTWNRVGYSMDGGVLSWFREWPEAA